MPRIACFCDWWNPNFISHLMKDVCSLLGIEKLNTTAYHPQCDGLTERFYKTLNTMLRKHAAKYWPQWDNRESCGHTTTLHTSQQAFLMFGVDLQSPTEAALFLLPSKLEPTTAEGYEKG